MSAFVPNPPVPGCGPSPNLVMGGEGFYISYNDHDIGIYGCDTTAIVLGQMQGFLILKGDHRSQYAPLVEQGLDRCLDYFRGNVAEAHPMSDKIENIRSADLLSPRTAARGVEDDESLDGPRPAF